MPDAIDPAQHVPPCLGASAENVRVQDVGVEEPSVPLPPGLCDVRLSEEAAQAMRGLLDDEGRSAHGGREMPTADASILRKTAR